MDPLAEARLRLNIEADHERGTQVTWVRTPRQAVTASGPSVDECNIMSDNDLSTTKVPVFNGKQSEFPVWWRRFKAHFKIKKFSKCLKSTAETDLPDSETEAATDTDVQKEAGSVTSWRFYASLWLSRLMH